jgi:nucleotide-binding universal stress UspA family protein
MFRHILAPVDFSPLSKLGLRWAGALTHCGGARLTVFYADPFSPPAYFTSSRIEALQARRAEELREAEEQLRQFTASALGTLEPWMDVEVAEALPVDAIVAAAEAGAADLIVMGTHGRSGFNRFMMGSVAERVLRQSRVPVLTVRGDADRPIQVRKILCPVNETPGARAALAAARGLAACTGAEVATVHVHEPGGPPPPEGVQVVREGEAAMEIVAAASQMSCDLLIVGAQRRRFYDATVLGTTTARVVRHAPCPVLTVVAAEAGQANKGEL